MAGRKKRRVSGKYKVFHLWVCQSWFSVFIAEVEGHLKAENKKVPAKAPPTPLLKPQLSEAEEAEEEEVMEEEERVETPADLLPTPTPDYAAGLGMDDTSIQPHTPSLYDSNFGRKKSETVSDSPLLQPCTSVCVCLCERERDARVCLTSAWESVCEWESVCV